MKSEGQNLEWKSAWRDEHLKWICGFANAQGGLLVIGKNDNGEIVGVRNPLRLLEDIPSKVQAQLGIVIDVNLKSEGEREYLEIRVDPHPNPISYKGEYHYRSGSTKQVLRGAALTRFLLGKHGRNWDDAPLPGVQLRDLDRRALDEFRRRGIASDRLPTDAIGESDGDLIELLHLREGEHLRRAAVLLFHPDPGQFFAGAFVKIGYFRTATDLAYQDVIEGNLFSQVNRTLDLLRTKYSKAEVSYEGIFRRETAQAPSDALREAVLNAIAHRDYSNPAPIQIRVYNDRVSLWNPGTLPPDWTLDRLMGTHASAPHNPGIANAFFRAGMIEAWGRGIENIVVTCRAAGTATPIWEVEPGGLRLDFVFTQMVDEPSSDDPNRRHEGFSRQSVQTEPAQPESQPESQLESQLESQPESLTTRVLRQLANGPKSKSELSSSLGQKRVSGQLNKVIRTLKAEGRITFTIPKKPRSRLQKYDLTDRGRAALDAPTNGRAGTDV
ncbi:MAG: putative DNA binding domain-containing protein [Gammaproteobacteria bacterium]|nr:putative DNA binding domain-containing protein [Gammaproteobacteria bacterium]